MEKVVINRIKTWCLRRNRSSGVLYDRNIPLKLKEKKNLQDNYNTGNALWLESWAIKMCSENESSWNDDTETDDDTLKERKNN